MKSKAQLRRIREHYARLRPPDGYATRPDGTFIPAESLTMQSRVSLIIGYSEEESWYNDPTYFMKGQPDEETKLRMVEAARRRASNKPTNSGDRVGSQTIDPPRIRTSLITSTDPSNYSVYETLQIFGRGAPLGCDGTPSGQLNLPGHAETRGRIATLIERESKRKGRD